MNSYVLRNVPDDLWTRAKHVAVDNKLSMRDLLIKALDKQVVVLERASKKSDDKPKKRS